MSGLDVDHFRARVLQDALSAATASFWRRRADDLRRGLGAPDDFSGRSTPEERTAREERILTDVRRCEHLARLLEEDRNISTEVIEAVGQVA